MTKLGTDLQAERQKRKELDARVVELSKRPPLARGGGLGVSAPVLSNAVPKPPALGLPDNVFRVEDTVGVGGVDDLDLSCLFNVEGRGDDSCSSHALSISQVGVRPVWVGVGVASAPPLNFISPAVQQVMRNLVAPKFTGRSQDWPQFWLDWERYLRKISM